MEALGLAIVIVGVLVYLAYKWKKFGAKYVSLLAIVSVLKSRYN